MNKYEARIFIKGVKGMTTMLSGGTLLIEASNPRKAMDKAKLLAKKKIRGLEKADVSIAIRLLD